MKIQRRRLRGKKLLVASATFSAVTLIGCGDGGPVANLMDGGAPPQTDAGPVANLMDGGAPPPTDAGPVANLMAIDAAPPTPDAASEDAAAEPNDGGTNAG